MEGRHPNTIHNTLPQKCLSWNVRGAGKPEFRVTLKDMIRINHPSIVALSVTRLNRTHASRLATEIRLLGPIRVDTIGFSAGI